MTSKNPWPGGVSCNRCQAVANGCGRLWQVLGSISSGSAAWVRKTLRQRSGRPEAPRKGGVVCPEARFAELANKLEWAAAYWGMPLPVKGSGGPRATGYGSHRDGGPRPGNRAKRYIAEYKELAAIRGCP